MRRLLAVLLHIEVAGGTHNGVVQPNLAAKFEFFNAKRRR